MTIRISNTLQNRVVDLFGSAFDAGKLRIYSGTQPASANSAATGTLLAEINLPIQAFQTSTGGVAPLAGQWWTTALASGTAGWFRLTDRLAEANIDGSVTITAGSGDLKLNSITITIGFVVEVTAFNLGTPI